MPKKTCVACQKENAIATKVCECGNKIGKTAKAKVKGPIAKSTYVPTGKPRGRPPSGNKKTPAPPSGKPRGRPPLGTTWDEKKKKYVEQTAA